MVGVVVGVPVDDGDPDASVGVGCSVLVAAGSWILGSVSVQPREGRQAGNRECQAEAQDVPARGVRHAVTLSHRRLWIG